MFLPLNGECSGTLSLILVGSGDMSPGDNLIEILYDPEKSGKDVTLWDDEVVKPDQKVEFEVKPKLELAQKPALDHYHYAAPPQSGRGVQGQG